MTPVPNCLITIEINMPNLFKGSLASSIGAKTPMALVTRTTNRVPIRRGMSYSRSLEVHDFELDSDSDSPSPTQCLLLLVDGVATRNSGTYSTPA